MDKQKKIKKSRDGVDILCYGVLIMVIVLMFVVKNSL